MARRLLEERGRGERLVVFNPAEYADFPAIVKFFSEQVRTPAGPGTSAGPSPACEWRRSLPNVLTSRCPTSRTALCSAFELPSLTRRQSNLNFGLNFGLLCWYLRSPRPASTALLFVKISCLRVL